MSITGRGGLRETTIVSAAERPEVKAVMGGRYPGP